MPIHLRLSLLLGLCISVPLFSASFELVTRGGVNTDQSVTLSPDLGVGNEMTSAGNRSGLSLGLRAQFPIFEALSLQSELNYVQRGILLGPAAAGSPLSQTLLANYLEMPFLLREEFDCGRLRPFLLTGPSVAVAVNRTIDSTNVSSGATTSSNASGSISPFDFGYYAGGGLDFLLNHAAHLTFDARYYYGLKDLDGAGLRNRGVQLLGGLNWRIE